MSFRLLLLLATVYPKLNQNGGILDSQISDPTVPDLIKNLSSRGNPTACLNLDKCGGSKKWEKNLKSACEEKKLEETRYF